jgi:outer membrane receptor protein involved in Fe transport
VLEVTCADPLDPCQLPFELGPDPPLEPVRSDTWQGGLRFSGTRARGSLVAYWTEVRDDIFNVVDETTPTHGYFTNLERTRRVGLEFGGSGTPLPRLPGLTLTASLGWTRATFESEADLASPLVEDDDDPPAPGDEEATGVHVEPGDRFPMTPELAATASVRYEMAPFALELGTTYTAPQYLIGDEGNEEELERMSASTVVDVAVEVDLGNATLFTKVDNVLDADFESFGMISVNARGPVTGVERFLAPGLPRRLTAGVRVRLGNGASAGG